MMRLSRYILLAAGLTAMAGTAHAKPQPKPFGPIAIEQPDFHDQYLPAEKDMLPKWAQKRINAGKAKSIAMSKYPGAEVIDVVPSGNAYRVRLIRKNGRVVDVFIDAVTGRVR